MMSTTPRLDRYTLMRSGYIMAATCELCGSAENLVIDHRIPLSQGGTNDLSNLRTLCQSCNTREGWRYRDRAQEPIDKYTTHLRPNTIKAIKVYAAAHDMKDYEVAQMIFDRFFQEQSPKNGER